MPLTEKGEEIKREMVKQYGKKRGEEVFYASANKGTITGVHRDAGQPAPRRISSTLKLNRGHYANAPPPRER